MKSWFEQMYSIERRIQELTLGYKPECEAFDEKAWNKQMNKLLKEREKLLREK